MNPGIQRIAALCGPAFVVLFIGGWWLIAGFVPPHPPTMDADALAAVYAANTGLIRFGILLAMISTAFVLPFTAILAAHIRRIEQGLPVLTYTELIGGALTTVILLVPTVLWSLAAFRPERSPEIILVLNDFAWMFFLMTFAPVCMQILALALAVLLDRRRPPRFPRWVGYFNVWVAVLFAPGGLLTFFKEGPFAWNGVLSFWLPLVAFVAWFFVMAVVLLQHVDTGSEAA